jgi:hypothetical protein
MRYTANQAKAWSMAIWRYLQAHIEITDKYQLPKLLRDACHKGGFSCPLCNWSFQECAKCPLGITGKGCLKANSPWQVWSATSSPYPEKQRGRAAWEIVEVIRDWVIPITAWEAKKVSLSFWKYRAENPASRSMHLLYLSPRLYVESEVYRNNCPVCQYQQQTQFNGRESALAGEYLCHKCPIALRDKHCANPQSAYQLWDHPRKGRVIKDRKEGADRIVAALEAWEV